MLIHHALEWTIGAYATWVIGAMTVILFKARYELINSQVSPGGHHEKKGLLVLKRGLFLALTTYPILLVGLAVIWGMWFGLSRLWLIPYLGGVIKQIDNIISLSLSLIINPITIIWFGGVLVVAWVYYLARSAMLFMSKKRSFDAWRKQQEIEAEENLEKQQAEFLKQKAITDGQPPLTDGDSGKDVDMLVPLENKVSTNNETTSVPIETPADSSKDTSLFDLADGRIESPADVFSKSNTQTVSPTEQQSVSQTVSPTEHNSASQINKGANYSIDKNNSPRDEIESINGIKITQDSNETPAMQRSMKYNSSPKNVGQVKKPTSESRAQDLHFTTMLKQLMTNYPESQAISDLKNAFDFQQICEQLYMQGGGFKYVGTNAHWFVISVCNPEIDQTLSLADLFQQMGLIDTRLNQTNIVAEFRDENLINVKPVQQIAEEGGLIYD